MRVEMGRCVLKPRTNNECRYSKAPAKAPRRIAVIGGGIGGKETAIQASARGHEADLYEKTTGRAAFCFFFGDCDRVGSLKTVIKQAYELVQDISYRR